jgi:hypothetical protein
MLFNVLEDRWLRKREEFARVGALVSAQSLIDEFLLDLRSVTEERSSELLTLETAARLSGYSADHLARLLREGKVPNSGQKHRPRISRKDLPEKRNSSLASARDSRYDPAADARSLRSRR